LFHQKEKETGIIETDKELLNVVENYLVHESVCLKNVAQVFIDTYTHLSPLERR